MFNLSENDALRIYNELQKRTVLPVYRGFFDEEKVPGLYDSKLGGVPYWDLTKPYPTGTDGQKLQLLAQIDLAAVPSQGELPSAGLLQIFIGEEMYGCDTEDPKPGEPHDYRVVYHKEINRDLTEKDILALEIPTNLTMDSPVKGDAIAICFDGPENEAMSEGDYQVEAVIRKIAAEFGIELPIFFDAFQFSQSLPEDIGDGWMRESEGLKLLGYPYFTQCDHRREGSRFDRLLLQIDSMAYRSRRGREVLWGDLGVGNFFINSEALQNGDFSDILYHWDCG